MQASGCVFNFNTASGGINGDNGGNGEGGALYSAGSAIISQTGFSGNTVQGAVGYDESLAAGFRPSGAGKGGAIYNSNSVAVVSCSLSDNEAKGVPGGNAAWVYAPSPGSGGAVYNAGSLFLTNNTLARNLAESGSTIYTDPSYGSRANGADAFGGAVCNSGVIVVSVNNTFALNDAQGGTGLTNGASYGGGIFSANGSVTLVNTILAH
jgi:hypothetical protein